MKTIYTLNEFNQQMSEGVIYATSIVPAFSKKNVAVTLVSSDEYAPFAAVVIQSLVENTTKENNYDIVLLTPDMSMENRWRIQDISKGKENVSIRVLDISKMVEGFTFYTWAHFTKNTYYRLLVPDVFESYEKIIYLDSDVIVNQDIAELYNTDVTDYYLAAAYDTHVVSYCTRKPPLEQRDYNIKTLKMKKPEEYFQAGVSLFNVSKIQKDFGPGFLFKKASEINLRWLDQDILNMFFYGNIKQLPNKWNVMISNVPENNDEIFLPEDLRKEYFEARRNPGIIHYVGRGMPCYTTKPDLYEYFWKYARHSVFYEILIQRMFMDSANQINELRRCIEELQQVIAAKQLAPQKKEKKSKKEKLYRFLRRICDKIAPAGSWRRYFIKKNYRLINPEKRG